MRTRDKEAGHVCTGSTGFTIIEVMVSIMILAVSVVSIFGAQFATVATVGFVSAGVLSFSQALGILFGANIGTTVTGWLVALLGFRLKIGSLVQPLLLAGVLLRMFGSARVARAGWGLAGFALVFLGLETLKEGMSSFEGVVSPESRTSTGWSTALRISCTTVATCAREPATVASLTSSYGSTRPCMSEVWSRVTLW